MGQDIRLSLRDCRAGGEVDLVRDDSASDVDNRHVLRACVPVDLWKCRIRVVDGAGREFSIGRMCCLPSSVCRADAGQGFGSSALHA